MLDVRVACELTGKSHTSCTRVAKCELRDRCELRASCAKSLECVNNKSVKLLIKVKRGDNNSRYISVVKLGQARNLALHERPSLSVWALSASFLAYACRT